MENVLVGKLTGKVEIGIAKRWEVYVGYDRKHYCFFFKKHGKFEKLR